MGQEPEVPVVDPPADPVVPVEPVVDPVDPPDDPDENLDTVALRAELKKTRAEAAKNRVEARDAKALAKKYEDENKTEAEKLKDRAEAAEQKLAAAERSALVASVALDKGLTQAQAKRLIGDTKEEFEADADELLASFKDENGGQDPHGRPRERLRPGAVPGADPEENDPAKLAEKVGRGW